MLFSPHLRSIFSRKRSQRPTKTKTKTTSRPCSSLPPPSGSLLKIKQTRAFNELIFPSPSSFLLPPPPGRQTPVQPVPRRKHTTSLAKTTRRAPEPSTYFPASPSTSPRMPPPLPPPSPLLLLLLLLQRNRSAPTTTPLWLGPKGGTLVPEGRKGASAGGKRLPSSRRAIGDGETCSAGVCLWITLWGWS